VLSPEYGVVDVYDADFFAFALDSPIECLVKGQALCNLFCSKLTTFFINHIKPNTLYWQIFWDIYLYMHMNFNDIQFLIHRV